MDWMFFLSLKDMLQMTFFSKVMRVGTINAQINCPAQKKEIEAKKIELRQAVC